MGRAERRRQERAERIEWNKTKVTMGRSDLIRLKEAIKEDVSANATEHLMVCFAAAMHNELGFGGKRILRVLNELDRLSGLIQKDANVIFEIRQQLKDETGVEIRS